MSPRFNFTDKNVTADAHVQYALTLTGCNPADAYSHRWEYAPVGIRTGRKNAPVRNAMQIALRSIENGAQIRATNSQAKSGNQTNF